MASRNKENKHYDGRKCCECIHAERWHHLSVSGIPTLAHCPFYLDGVYCVWRSKAACEHFKDKET